MLDTIFKEPALKEPKDIFNFLLSALLEITANINGCNENIDASKGLELRVPTIGCIRSDGLSLIDNQPKRVGVP